MIRYLKSLFSLGIYTTVEKCDSCGEVNFYNIKKLDAKEWVPVKKYYTENPEENPFVKLPNKFKLLQCKNCGLVFVSPRIQDKVVNRFYDEYLSGKYKDYIPQYIPEFRREIFSRYFNDAAQHFPSFSDNAKCYLDVGCATGDFLDVANKNGFKSFGIEVSPKCGAIAKQYGEVFVGDVLYALDQTPNDKFDFVTLIDSIEHFPSPSTALKNIFLKMKKGGIIFIETPNYESGHDEMSRHFYLFSTRTITSLLKASGFLIKDVHTTDSQYNSTDDVIKNRFLIAIAEK